MLCTHCQTQNLPNSQFCAYCAEPLPVCQTCGSVQAVADARFCQQCGSALVVKTVVQASLHRSSISPLKITFWVIMGFAAVGWVSYQSTKPSPPVNLVGDLAYAQSLLPTPTPGQPSLESKWRYDTETDEMTGKSEKSASVVSGNSFEFGFPYRGVQHAELTLRDHPRYGKNVILSIERGQFMAGVLGCAVTVRFDDQAPQKYWARGAADNSTETIFLNNYSKFVTSTRKSRTLRLSTEVYHEGSPVFEFNISGLKDF